MTKIQRSTVFLKHLTALAWLCVGVLARHRSLNFYRHFDQSKRSYTAHTLSLGLKWRYGSSYGASLVLPPKGNQDLCNSTWDAPDGLDPLEPVAILTQQGGCSMDKKIESLLAGIEQIPLQSRHWTTFVILYGDSPAASHYTDTDLSTIGFLTIDQRTGEDIIRQEILPNKEFGEGSPYLLDPSNNDWYLPFSMEPVQGETDNPNETDAPPPVHELDPIFSGILFSVLFCVVFCCPAIMKLCLWYTDGGRIDYTRHGQRVHILPPGVLTQSEVLALPEISYRQELSRPNTELVTDKEQPNLSTLDVEDSDEGFTTSCTACSICLENFVEDEKVRLLPNCRHAFHTECIMPWLTTRKPFCPLCNVDVHSVVNDVALGSDDQNGRGALEIPC